MSPHKFAVLALVVPALQCFGAGPVATVSSTEALVVSGISVPTNRLMSWPVSANDEIATLSAPAMVRFTDGTVMTLQRNSRMRLEQSQSGVHVKMLAGSAMYDLKPTSTVSVGQVMASAATRTTAAVNVPARAAAASAQNQAVAEGLVYRMPATAAKSGMVLAPMAISAAQFTPAASKQDYTTPNPGVQKIVLPNGIIFEVTQTGPGTFIINRILIPVTNASGQPAYANVVSSPLLGGGILVKNEPGEGPQITIFDKGGQVIPPGTAFDQIGAAADNAVANAPGSKRRRRGPIDEDDDDMSPGERHHRERP